MHKKIFFILILVTGLLILVPRVGADEKQEPTLTIAQQLPLRDPFESKLPKPEQKPRPGIAVPPTPEQIKSSQPTPSPVPPMTREAPRQPPKLTIYGIIWNSHRPQAIVNNQVVDIGDTINNSKIVSIEKTGIDILFEGEKYTITY